MNKQPRNGFSFSNRKLFNVFIPSLTKYNTGHKNPLLQAICYICFISSFAYISQASTDATSGNETEKFGTDDESNLNTEGFFLIKIKFFCH